MKKRQTQTDAVNTVEIQKYKDYSLFSRYGIVSLVALFVLVFSLASPAFMTARNWSSLIVGQVAVACIALGAICPMIAGEFDFSVGYAIGLLAIIGATVAQRTSSAVVVIAAVLLSGMLIGLVNGVIAIMLHINSTVVTLGMGLVYYGINMAISDGRTITGNIPPILSAVAKTKVLNFNISVWIIVLMALVLWYLMEHTPFGKQLYAVGLCERAAHLSGVRTRLLKIIAFVICDVCIAFGALFLLGQSGSAAPNTGPSYQLSAYAVCFLSITTHKAGKFNIPGLMLSILMLAIGFNGLSLLGGPFWMESVFNGIILIVAILTTKSDARTVIIG